MRRWLWLFAALVATPVWAERITLEEAVRIGLENSIAIRNAQSQVRQAQQLSRQAIGQLGFRLDGLATYERYDAASSFGPGITGSRDAQRASLVLSYPVDIIGLNRQAARASQRNESAVRENVTIESLAVKRSVREAFFNVLRAEWSVQVAQEALEAAQARLQITQARFNAGDVARFDVLRLETEVQRNASDLENAKNNVELAEQLLNNVLSREVGTPVEIESGYQDVRNAQLPSVDLAEAPLLALAYANRPELRQLDQFLEARRFLTQTRRAGNTPSLSLSATYTRTINPSAFQRENAVTLAANLSFPLWDSGITRARIAEAKEDELQTQLNLERARLGIGLDVKNSLVRLRNAAALVTFAEKTVALQTEALRLAELRYQAGEGILLDVTTADADLRAALGNLVNSRVEYLIAFAALQAATGVDQLPNPTQPPQS